MSACGQAFFACGTGCADIIRDALNCGGCGNACAAGEQCAWSVCVAVAPARGCSQCPCADCDVNLPDTCCQTDAGPTCSAWFGCPQP